MIRIKNWMYPSYYSDRAGNVHCTFLTSDGKRHHIKCRWQMSRQVYVFRFRGETWETTCTG